MARSRTGRGGNKMTQPTKQEINECLAKFDGWISSSRFVSKYRTTDGKLSDELPDYTLNSSLPDVMRVAERLRKKKYIITIGSSKKEGCNWYCMIEKSWTGTCYWGEADTYAEAIARACYEVLKEVKK